VHKSDSPPGRAAPHRLTRKPRQRCRHRSRRASDHPRLRRDLRSISPSHRRSSMRSVQNRTRHRKAPHDLTVHCGSAVGIMRRILIVAALVATIVSPIRAQVYGQPTGQGRTGPANPPLPPPVLAPLPSNVDPVGPPSLSQYPPPKPSKPNATRRARGRTSKQKPRPCGRGYKFVASRSQTFTPTALVGSIATICYEVRPFLITN
jgi:hypothetical protein